MGVSVDLPPPPDVLDRSGGGSWVRLVTAINDIDAHLLAGRLTEAGIDTRTVKDRKAPGAWLYGGSNPWAPANIYVRSLDLQAARLVLAEVAYSDTPALDPAATHSPDRWHKPTMWWVTALALGLVLSGLVLAQVARWTGTCQLPILCAQDRP